MSSKCPNHTILYLILLTGEMQTNWPTGNQSTNNQPWCTIFGGGCTKQGGEAAVRHFITQQTILFLAELGVMRVNKRGNERGER